MYIQELVAKIDNPTQEITIECISSKEVIETNAYLCKRILHMVEKISADNLKLTVSDDVFEKIKNII